MRKIIVAGVFLILAVLFGNSAGLRARASDPDSLRGVGSMDVAVVQSALGISSLTDKAIQTDVELKLRVAGIKVDSSAIPVGIPVLSVTVNWLAPEVAGLHFGYSYVVSVQFHQLVTAKTGWQGSACTWESASIGVSPLEDAGRRIRQAVKDAVDEFLNDYLSVNPREPSQ